MQRPKRRRYKDNPYRLEIDNVCKVYIVSFKDSHGIIQKVEISEEIFNALDKFELEDLSEMNEYDNHIEHSELLEQSLYARAKNKPESVEEEALRNITLESIMNLIDDLPDIQKRRVIKYFLYDMTLDQIAKTEGCTKMAVKFSIDIAIKNIRKAIDNNITVKSNLFL